MPSTPAASRPTEFLQRPSAATQALRDELALGLAQPHDDSRPDEQQALNLPDDLLRSCKSSVPDTSNLTPVPASAAVDLGAPAQAPASGAAGRQ